MNNKFESTIRRLKEYQNILLEMIPEIQGLNIPNLRERIKACIDAIDDAILSLELNLLYKPTEAKNDLLGVIEVLNYIILDYQKYSKGRPLAVDHNYQDLKRMVEHFLPGIIGYIDQQI